MSDTTPLAPRYGEVWTIDLEPTTGREQRKERPCVIISADEFNGGGADLVIAAPITKGGHPRVPWHIDVEKGEGGLRFSGHVMCEQMRTLSLQRFSGSAWGRLADSTMRMVRDRLMVLLDLYQ